MNNTFARQKIAEGVYFNTVSDDRFKTVKISVNAFVPMKKETAAQNALLSQVLTRSCERYPTLAKLSQRLSYLYGASLYGGVSKVGDAQMVMISAAAIDDRYTADGKPISAGVAELICDVIFNPLLENGAFVSGELEQERRQLFEMLDSEFNDKQVYAKESCNRLMCEGEPYGLARCGEREDIAAVTPQRLYAAWQKLLDEAHFEIMYVGAAVANEAIETFRKAFSSRTHAPEKIKHIVVGKALQARSFEEEMELSQSKLVMGLRTPINESDCDTTAMRLACTILGGTANSKLFNNVREKLSLCYYCSSRYNRLKGIVTIQSGVQAENIDKAREAILNEIDEMKRGNISDFEFNCAKLAVCDSFKGYTDTIDGLESWYSTQLLFDKINTTEDEIKRFEKVTKQEVIDAARTITLDTVYVLRGNGEAAQ